MKAEIDALLDIAVYASLVFDDQASKAMLAGDQRAAADALRLHQDLSAAIHEVAVAQIAAMTEDDMREFNEAHGITAEAIDAGVDKIQAMLAEHRRNSDARKAEPPKPVDPHEMIRFELECVDNGIDDLWFAVFGPEKPMPTTGTPRLQALSQLLAACLTVRWPRPERQPTPKFALLPVGSVPDGILDHVDVVGPVQSGTLRPTRLKDKPS